MGLRTIAFFIGISLLFPMPSFSQGSGSNQIGWFFDEAGAQRCASGQPYETVTAFLCLISPTTNYCAGWELSTTVFGNCVVTSWDIQGDGVNVATAPDFIVGYGAGPSDPPAINQHGIIVLCTADILLLDDEEVSLYVGPVVNASIANQMVFIDGNRDDNLEIMTPSSGSTSVPTSWVNSDDWPCSSNNYGKNHRVIVKTNPGIVNISNPSGGDKLGNITFNSIEIDSLASLFQVDEVSKVTGAGPDSVNYHVRVTGEQKVSYVNRDRFIFVLPDSNDRDSFATALESLSDVKSATPWRAASACLFPNDPNIGYHIDNPWFSGGTVDIQDGWDIVPVGDATITIIDSGIDPSHSDLMGIVSGEFGMPGSDPHGTQVAGLAAAQKNNAFGVAGMAPVQLWNKHFRWNNTPGADGQDRFVDVLHQVMGTDYPIANFSGSWSSDPDLRTTCSLFYNSNRILVSSAGNENSTTPIYYPAKYSSVIAVGAIDRYGALSEFNVGEEMDFTAHGKLVWTTTTIADGQPTQDYCRQVNGTSFSAPIVSGAAAILLSYNPNLFNDDVYNLLAMSATTSTLVDPSPTLYEDAFGHGLVQVSAALDSLIRNSFIGGAEVGYDRSQMTNMGNRIVYGLPGYSDGSYTVRRYELEKDISFPTSFIELPHVWGRGAATSGIKKILSNPMYIDIKQQCEIKPGSLTTSGCTLISYVYHFTGPWPNNGQFYFPSSPSNMEWGYAALGKDGFSSVREVDSALKRLELSAYPNPFNAKINFLVKVSRPGQVNVSVYDMRGQKVVEL
ncbi:MAG: S8 family serine peptidase, partial [Desulfuromusa sp.]|nr:S8 family serine peptidase [Desulfuromusa sp.]